MLTPQDIYDPKLKSEYKNVRYERVAGRPKPYVAQIRNPDRSPGKGSHIQVGPHRTTGVEAAQDFCDYINSRPPLTIEDIRNPKTKSGFDYVSVKNADTRPKPYSASSGSKPSIAGVKQSYWQGPRRATAEKAAQDYCDYINGQRTTQTNAWPTYEAPTVDMGNTTDYAPVQETVKIERIPYEGPHDLYDVLLYDAETGQVMRRKAGITARGSKRYADISKTFGFSIRPFQDAVQLPSKAAALVAETARVAEIARDPNWRQVGKECFAPATSTDLVVSTV